MLKKYILPHTVYICPCHDPFYRFLMEPSMQKIYIYWVQNWSNILNSFKKIKENLSFNKLLCKHWIRPVSWLLHICKGNVFQLSDSLLLMMMTATHPIDYCEALHQIDHPGILVQIEMVLLKTRTQFHFLSHHSLIGRSAVVGEDGGKKSTTN